METTTAPVKVGAPSQKLAVCECGWSERGHFVTVANARKAHKKECPGEIMTMNAPPSAATEIWDPPITVRCPCGWSALADSAKVFRKHRETCTAFIPSS